MRYQETIIFDGKKLATEKEKVLQEEAKKLTARLGFRPKLVSVLVGENLASRKYLELKKAAGERIGVEVLIKQFLPRQATSTLAPYLAQLNLQKEIWGVIIQFPLPEGVDPKIIEIINPAKDVDCLTRANLALLKKGKPRFFTGDGERNFRNLEVWENKTGEEENRRYWGEGFCWSTVGSLSSIPRT